MKTSCCTASFSTTARSATHLKRPSPRDRSACYPAGAFSALCGSPRACCSPWSATGRACPAMPRPCTYRCRTIPRPCGATSLRLVEANRAFNSTLRVVVVRNSGGMWEGPGNGRAERYHRPHRRIPRTGATACASAYVPQARHAACRFAGTKILSWVHEPDLARRGAGRGLRRGDPAQRARRGGRVHLRQHLHRRGQPGFYAAPQLRLPARHHARIAAFRCSGAGLRGMREGNRTRRTWRRRTMCSSPRPRATCCRWRRSTGRKIVATGNAPRRVADKRFRLRAAVRGGAPRQVGHPKRKRFQVIRVPASSPPACAALSLAVRTAGRLPVCSPPFPFGTGGSLLAGAPAGVSCPEPASRSGLSLARNDCPLPDHHCGVKVPGLPLQRPARPLAGTVPPATTPPPPVCTRHGRYQGRWPVSRLAVRHSRARIGSPLPFGAFTPSGSKRSTRLGPGKPTFRIRPIALRSPHPLYFVVAVADHRSGLATFPEARCSSNLLEPHSSCIQALNESIINSCGSSLFHRKR